MARYSTSSGAKSRASVVWTLSTPTTCSSQTSGMDSIARRPAMSKPRTQLNRSSVVTSRAMTGVRSAAALPVMPSPSDRLTRPTCARSRPLVAASVSVWPSRSRR